MLERRILHFPLNLSIGHLAIRRSNSNDDWRSLDDAVGSVEIPPNSDVKLEISSIVSFDTSMLSGLNFDSLCELQWVSTSNVNDKNSSFLRSLTGLRGVALWETPIGDFTLSCLGYLSNLRWLDIGDTEVTDHGLEYLRGLRSLRQLTLLNDRITDNGIFCLKGLYQLINLDLMNTSITDLSIDVLSTMTKLRHLRIFNTQITRAGFTQLNEALPQCTIRYHSSN